MVMFCFLLDFCIEQKVEDIILFLYYQKSLEEILQLS